MVLRKPSPCRRPVTLAAAAVLILVFGAQLPGQRAASASAVDAAVRVTIDLAREHQTIEGFGATTQSAVQQGRDMLGPELRARALDAVYRQVRLSVGNLDAMLLESPGSFAERRNDNNDSAVSLDSAAKQTQGSVSQLAKASVAQSKQVALASESVAAMASLIAVRISSSLSARGMKPWMTSISPRSRAARSSRPASWKTVRLSWRCFTSLARVSTIC